MALPKLQLTLEIEGDKAVVTGLKNVDQAVDNTARNTKTATGRMAADLNNVETATGRMASWFDNIGNKIKGVVAAWASWELIQKAKDATLFAANVEQADRALSVIANTMGMTSREALKYRDSLRDMNITTNSATNATAQFIKSGFPLDKLNQLGTAAQGAAISYQMMTGETISSSAALDKMIRALVTGNVTELHTLGINVMLRDVLRENKKATGEAALEVESHQRKLLMLNDVLQKTEPLMHLYASSTDLASKQISSSKRPIEELRLALGNLFLPELTVLATNFYQTVAGGMKWVKAHTAEINAAKEMIKDFSQGLVYGAGVLGVYAVSMGIASAANGGFLAGAGMFAPLLATMQTSLSLTGAEAIITGTKVGVMGEVITTATRKATLGVLSLQTAFGVFGAFMIGWEVGKMLSAKFEIVQKAGIYMVHGLVKAWDYASEAYERFRATVNPFGDEEEQQRALQLLTAKYEAIKKTRDDALSGSLADVGKEPQQKASYQDNADWIAKGLADAKAFAAKIAAEKLAAQSDELAKEQTAQQAYNEKIHAAYLEYQKAFEANEMNKAKLIGETDLAINKANFDKKLINAVEYAEKEKTIREQMLNAELRVAYDKQVEARIELDRATKAATYKGEVLGTPELWKAEAKYQSALKETATLQAKLATTTIENDGAVYSARETLLKQSVELERMNIAAQLAAIDTAEKFYQITTGEAATKRLALQQQSLDLETRYAATIQGSAPEIEILRKKQAEDIRKINVEIDATNKLLREQSALGGAISALNEYYRMAVDIGAQTKGVVTSFLTGMEDALTKFVRTGKLNFTDLVNSMLDQMARVTVQQSFTGPLSKWLSGVANNYSGGLSFGSAGGSYGVLSSDANSYGVLAANGNSGAAGTDWGGSLFGAAGTAASSYLSGAGASAAGSSYGVLASDAGYSGFGAGSWFGGGGASSGAATGTSSAAGGMSATGYGLILMGIVGSIQSMVSMFEGTNKRWDNLQTREKVAYWQNVALQGLDGLTGGKVFGGQVSSHGGIELGVNAGQATGGIWSKTTTSGGWLSSGRSTKTYESFDSAWGGFVNEQMTSIKKALTAGTAVMSRDSGVVDALMASFSVATKRIDMKDMSSEEQQQAIADFYRNVSNEAIDKLYTSQSSTYGNDKYGNIIESIVNVNALDQYRRVGEDSTATFARLSSSATLVNDLFSTLGLTLNEFSLQGAAVSDSLVQALGGMQQAQSTISSYYNSGLFSKTEQDQMRLASAQRAVATTFAELHIAIPRNNMEYRELVKQQLALGTSGTATAAALMNVADAFGTLTEVSRNASDTMRELQGGGLSTLSADNQYQMAKATIMGASNTEFAGMANSFLTRSQAVNASGSGYVADYNMVMDRLAQIAAGSSSTQGSSEIVAAVQTSNEEAKSQTQVMITAYTELINLTKTMVEKLASLENSALAADN